MNLNSLNIFDILVITIISLSTLFALFRGFVGTLLSLVGWVLSIYITYKFSPIIKTYLTAKISNPVIVSSLSWIGLLLFSLIFFGIFNSIVSGFVGKLHLTFLDKILGGAFGFLRGFLLISVIYLIISLSISSIYGTDEKDEARTGPNWLINAQTYNFVKTGKQLLLSFVGSDFKKRIEEFYEGISQKSKDERFITSSIEKLKTLLPKDIVDQIDKEKDKNSLTKSDEGVEMETLRGLLNYYNDYKKSISNKSKKSEGNTKDSQNNKAEFSESEVERLKKIIGDYNQRQGEENEKS